SPPSARLAPVATLALKKVLRSSPEPSLPRREAIESSPEFLIERLAWPTIRQALGKAPDRPVRLNKLCSKGLGGALRRGRARAIEFRPFEEGIQDPRGVDVHDGNRAKILVEHDEVRRLAECDRARLVLVELQPRAVDRVSEQHRVEAHDLL